jgi:hypothetical protein
VVAPMMLLSRRLDAAKKSRQLMIIFLSGWTLCNIVLYIPMMRILLDPLSNLDFNAIALVVCKFSFPLPRRHMKSELTIWI